MTDQWTDKAREILGKWKWGGAPIDLELDEYSLEELIFDGEALRAEIATALREAYEKGREQGRKELILTVDVMGVGGDSLGSGGGGGTKKP